MDSRLKLVANPLKPIMRKKCPSLKRRNIWERSSGSAIGPSTGRVSMKAVTLISVFAFRIKMHFWHSLMASFGAPLDLRILFSVISMERFLDSLPGWTSSQESLTVQTLQLLLFTARCMLNLATQEERLFSTHISTMERSLRALKTTSYIWSTKTMLDSINLSFMIETLLVLLIASMKETD